MLVLGTIDLLIILPFFLISLLFVFNAGILIMAHQQAAYAAEVATDYLVQNHDTPNSSPLSTVVQDALKRSGSSMTNIKVSPTQHWVTIALPGNGAGDAQCIWEVSVSGTQPLMGSNGWMPSLQNIQSSAVAYMPTHCLIGMSATQTRPAMPPGDIWTRPTADRNLWLPAARLDPGGSESTPKYMYRDLRDAMLPDMFFMCIHHEETIMHDIGMVGPTISVTSNQVGPNDPR